MVTFREASPDDPDAQAVLTEYFAQRAAGFPGGGYAPVPPSAAAFTAPDGVLLLVEEEGLVVGSGGIRRAPGAEGVTVYEIKHVYLRPHTRGRGWGRALMDELERRARAWEASALVLDTHHTLGAAGRLYRSLGYAEIAPYNDNPNATRWYRKELS